MIVIPILISIALLGVVIACYYYVFKRTNKWGLSIWIILAFLVPLMSHIWHLVDGEEFIGAQCEIDETVTLGWTECMSTTDFYTAFLDSYEITVSIETIFFYTIGVVIMFREPLFQKEVNTSTTVKTQHVVSILLISGILSAFVLIFLPYSQMDWYVVVFNFYNIFMLLICMIFVYQKLEGNITYKDLSKKDDVDNIQPQQEPEQTQPPESLQMFRF